MRKILFSLILMSFFYSKSQAQDGIVRGSTFVVKENTTHRINDKLTIVDTLILRKGATLTFEKDITDWELHCNVLVMEKGSRIKGVGADGESKENVSQSPNGGSNGQNGHLGADGKNAQNGVNIKIFATSIFWGDFMINTSGGNGGSAGPGGEAAKGTNATCDKRAGAGGNGGKGGDAGSGGDAGTIEITYQNMTIIGGGLLTSKNFKTGGGGPGKPGAGGKAGKGGNKRSGCANPLQNRSKGNNGHDGPVGNSGLYGKSTTVVFTKI